ncbi:zinc-dependent metalloprotease [Cellulomonas marina]|uniref:Putative hydrolase/uncharacterized protein, coenzyme F420 biosynthesis associated n=1 Tax=Cellulomonas marina TaxID=988821 RepID=A0A1I0WME3_9CELL|nr:zinc-dependent metalloprotease [Cellulomonas marina]GIG27752.1 hypothetical protein Cma02nite_03520 [Cellulomonas marina]SFA89922.1 putative hydrolase/uncharacterized protein, coenzyme F420 biosynthesis associated [Cellulomonas marina]
MPDTRDPVDWDAAARLAGRLAPRGPAAGRAELVDLVAELRDAAARAAGHVALLAHLQPADGRPPRAAATVHVVDRPRWAEANVGTFAALSAPLTDALVRSAQDRGRRTPRVTAAARAAGAAQLGGLLALLSSKVLGQFDPFGAPAGAPGRLLLVAPNVLATERALRVHAADFRLWVSLHEQTHALQFAAAPWLAGHLRERVVELGTGLAGRLRPAGDETGDEGVDEGGDGSGHGGARGAVPGDDDEGGLADLLRGAVRAARGGPGSAGLLELLPAPQRRAAEEVTAVMSLLEGHADVTMDQVGADVVPTVRTIRRRFEARRDAAASAGGPAGLLRRLLGLDAKLAQYRDGARFVRGVRRRAGARGLDPVWADAAHLPTPAELADPRAWVRRVHG